MKKRAKRRFVQLALAATVVFGILSTHHEPIFPSTFQDITSIRQFSEPKHDEITVITYSDRVTSGLCRSMVAAARHGFELYILGVDEASFSGFTGDPKMKKFLGMKALLSNETLFGTFGLHKSSTLIFADASDVIYLSNLKEVNERFHDISRERGENVVLVAAERNCWPYMVKEKEIIPGGTTKCAEFPSQNSTFRYLNSGAYIGKVEAVKAMIASAYERLGAARDDQLALHELYAEQLRDIGKGNGGKYRFKIVLDQRALIFQTGWGTNLEGERYADREENGAYYDTQGGRVINTEHDTEPFLVHFNGGKSALQPVSAAVLAKELVELDDVRRINSILKMYRAKHNWFASECASLDDIALFYKRVENAFAEDYSKANDTIHMSSEMRFVSSVPPTRAEPASHETPTQSPEILAITCPPGYPAMRSREEGAQLECALQYFRKALSDARHIAREGIADVSLTQMRRVVQKSPQQLGLYVLTKHKSTGGATWTHMSGQGANFWATKPFHEFMTRHVETIASRLPAAQRVYFVINGFDEPVVSGECQNLSQLMAIHPNVREGIVNRKEGVPVWSMSKVRDCHTDLLFPHPDMLAKFGRIAEMSFNRPWKQRKDTVVFRGSSTGMGNIDTNLRVKVTRALLNTSGFDVGIHAAIQTINKDSIMDLMKPKLEASEWSSYRYALDIDGNAHSFNRPLAIARAGCTLLRVNVFTDLFDEGLLNEIHAFDVDPTKVELDAPRVLHKLQEAPDKAQAAAALLSETHQWLTEDVIRIYMREVVTEYVRAVHFVD